MFMIDSMCYSVNKIGIYLLKDNNWINFSKGLDKAVWYYWVGPFMDDFSKDGRFYTDIIGLKKIKNSIYAYGVGFYKLDNYTETWIRLDTDMDYFPKSGGTMYIYSIDFNKEKVVAEIFNSFNEGTVPYKYYFNEELKNWIKIENK